MNEKNNSEVSLIDTERAPAAPGPFSHAAEVADWVYTSGMGGLLPETGEVISDDVIEQTEQAIRNVEEILSAAGCGLTDVVKVTLYLTDMADYPRVNKVYEDAFSPHKPARTCVAVSALPVRERMKLDTVAYKAAR
ncbi:MAG: putative reactive intermediate deaminase TdcF [Alphaproteobacteria bacterium MarineAlpha11_Bin1]|nr:MAG: putative reactive intermediate deaminase TdcF [Alphaproteobacteria bacterium MarineAlpha11_Bin1]|tara:strand:+ start:45878 stop:46285 length:408 start_codon:yes stop_codon:yes gene_type:complete